MPDALVDWLVCLSFSLLAIYIWIKYILGWED